MIASKLEEKNRPTRCTN